MKTRNLIIISLLIICPLFTTGCLEAAVVGVAAGGGAATVAYIKGELKATEEASIDKTWAATVKAVDEMQFLVINKLKDAVSAEYELRTADNKKIHIELDRITENLTEIKIRVGTFGDESLSRYILTKIQSHL